MASDSTPSSPVDWLNNDVISKAKKDINIDKNMLLLSSVGLKLIGNWIYRQIFDEMVELKLYSPSNDNLFEYMSMDLSSMDQRKSNQIRKIILQEYQFAALRWASHAWKNSLESIFLKHSDKLASAEYIIVACKSKDMLYENFHQLRACETTISNLQDNSRILDIKVHSLTPIINIPEPFCSKIKKNKNNRFILPFSYLNGYAFLIIEEFNFPTLESLTEQEIIQHELNDWISETTSLVLRHL